MSNNNKFKKRRWTESIFRLISRSSSRRSSGKGTSPRSREQGAKRRTPTGLPSEVQGGAGLEGGGWRGGGGQPVVGLREEVGPLVRSWVDRWRCNGERRAGCKERMREGGGYVGVGQREFSGGCDKDFSLRLEDSPGYCDSV